MELLGPPLFWGRSGRRCGGDGLAGSELAACHLPHHPQGRGKQAPGRVCGPGASPLETASSLDLLPKQGDLTLLPNLGEP